MQVSVPVHDGQWNKPEYWLQLAPHMHIGALRHTSVAHRIALDDAALGAVQKKLNMDGCFHLEPLTWQHDLQHTAAAIAAVQQSGWGALFAFVYDEIWTMYQQLHPLLSSLLGNEYRRLPDFWAWHIDTRQDARGWAPHRDKGKRALLPDGSPQTLTVWLPLTDATPLNSCIYIVPAGLDPTYNTGREDQYEFYLQSIRALPAAAGSVLAWNAAVLHWGGTSSAQAIAPRISVAIEFQRGDVAPFKLPLAKPERIPGFQERLALIARQIVQYEHIHRLEPDAIALAHAILAAAPACEWHD